MGMKDNMAWRLAMTSNLWYRLHTETPTKGAGTTATTEGGSSKIEELLTQLVTSVNQPVYLQFSDGTVQKITNRSAFIGRMGSKMGLG